jgi:hypothetical protein
VASEHANEHPTPWIVDRAKAVGNFFSRGEVLAALSVLAVVLVLASEAAAHGVGHFEFQLANDRDGVLRILRDNRSTFAAHGFDGVRNNIYVDFAFILVWVPLLIGLLQFVKRHWYSIPRVHRIINLMMISIFLAGVFDYIETSLILSYLPERLSGDAIRAIGSFAPMLATAFAIGKYVAIVVTVAIIIPALLGSLWRAVSRVVPFRHFKWTRFLSMQALQRPDPYSESPVHESPRPCGGVGVCFSGGGIRAGSFALGGIQALQEEGVLGKGPGMMTSVSGGGYLAGAYEMARTRGVFAEGTATPPPLAPGSDEEQFIRNHSAYLTYERGQKTAALGHLVRGIGINTIAVFALLYLVLRPAGWALWELNDGLVKTEDGVETFLFAIPAAHLLAVAMILGLASIAYFLTMMPTLVGEADLNDAVATTARATMGWALITALLLLGIPAALWFAFVAVPFLFQWLAEIVPIGDDDGDNQGKQRILTFLGTGGSLAFILEGVRRQLQKASTSVWALIAAAVVLPALLLFIVASVVKGGYVNGVSTGAAPFGQEMSEGWYWLIILGLTLFLGLTSDQRGWSLHRFYKRRLANAFSVQRVRSSGSTHAEQIPYSQHAYFKTPRGQFPLVVACVANVNDYGVVPPGLNAVSFTMAESQIGGPQLGYVDTDVLKLRLERRVRRRDITVQAAVAVSGAAASPAMGKMSKPMLRFLIAFANVRLGVWFPNPRWLEANGLDKAPSSDKPEHEMTEAEKEKLRAWNVLTDPKSDEEAMERAEKDIEQWYDRPRLPYLFKEMFGLHSIDDRFLYLTDGGHIDNLGLVELFRRGCTSIYAFDASGGEPGTFATIGEAMAIARAELGVTVELDLAAIRPADAEPPPGSSGSSSWSSAEAGTGWPWSRQRPIRGGTLVKQPYAIGWYSYPGDPTRHKIVYIQAAAAASMPWSVRWYWEQNPSFPNHTTIDQNFDFREFEAYRELGSWAATVAHEEFSKSAPEG